MPQAKMQSDIFGAGRGSAATSGSVTSEVATTAKGAFGDMTTKVKEKAAEFGHAAGDALHTSRISTANALDGAAKYVRSHGASEIKADVEQLVKGNPGKSVLAAAAVGFLLARTLDRRD
ncbi:MAG TPA: hypothetical protein VHE78_09655 [Gemmatimonadaceae bacterium]|nr:hypothetical protein [Gemmatimonadaceae bacterium]